MQWHTIMHAVLLGYPDCHNQTVAGASLLACLGARQLRCEGLKWVIFDGFIREIVGRLMSASARKRRTGVEPEALCLAGLP